MRNLMLFFYYLLISKLPRSHFPLGKLFNDIRIFWVSRILKIGKDCKFQDQIYIGNGKGIEIGNHCQINEHVKLDNVKIGNYVMIARHVTFLGKKHNFNSLNVPMILQGMVESMPTVVEDDVWIGANAIVMPGLTIRKGSIVGAGAVLTKDTQPFSIMCGVPARLLRCRIKTNE